MTGNCSFTIACHVDPEFYITKITLARGDLLVVSAITKT
nr:MAG TPA: hypothetical protein [Caudoviricetes sp.]